VQGWRSLNSMRSVFTLGILSPRFRENPSFPRYFGLRASEYHWCDLLLSRLIGLSLRSFHSTLKAPTTMPSASSPLMSRYWRKSILIPLWIIQITHQIIGGAVWYIAAAVFWNFCMTSGCPSHSDRPDTLYRYGNNHLYPCTISLLFSSIDMLSQG
jgi:hypothetical protein